MTDRLYYTDPYSTEFDATVRRVDLQDGRALVGLDRTFFYPTTGGQPFDTGMLGSHRVVDVSEDDEGDIVHVIEAGSTPLHTARPRPAAFAEAPADRRSLGGGWLDPATEAGPGRPALSIQPGQHVHGVIDWPRRFDHMQQHTGQHVLSAAFDRLFHVLTVSFHLGAELSTIDLAREMTARELEAAEDEANRIVWANRPVTIRFVSAEEATNLPLRKEPVRGGKLRLIEVEDFDLSACGGTHVARTGEIGLIAVTAWERFKGGQRLEFHCGRRALARLRLMRDATAASAKLLSVTPGELPEAIDRLLNENKDRRRALTALQNDLAQYRAAELAARAESTARGRLATAAIDADANTLKTLAAAVASREGLVVVLTSATRPSLIVVARSAGVAVAAQEVLAQLVAKFGGKGGGKPDLAQGGGLDAPAEAIFTEVRTILR